MCLSVPRDRGDRPYPGATGGARPNPTAQTTASAKARPPNPDRPNPDRPDRYQGVVEVVEVGVRVREDDHPQAHFAGLGELVGRARQVERRDDRLR